MADDIASAVAIARAAGRLLLDRSTRAPTGVSSKSTLTDLVSDADRAADELVVSRLRNAYPDDAIVSEEGGAIGGRSGRTWYVDPLDGTINYLYGLPHWAVSIACHDAAGALVGVVFDPARNEVFQAHRGQGALLGDRRLAVTAATDLGFALVGTGFSYDPQERARQATVVARLAGKVRDIRRAGSAALDLAWVAAGRLDAYFEVSRSKWDSAAGELLVAEAGGVVSWTEHTEIVASGRPLHASLITLLRAGHGTDG